MKKDTTPKVGIALLAYNQGKYVDDAINSLKKQSFQDFEIILADDGSNDGFTPEKLQSIDYEKIKKKVLDKKNLGNAQRRKQLYALLDNKYIMDFSADDILDERYLEKTVSYLEKHAETGAVSTNIVYFDSNPSDGYAIERYDKRKMSFPSLLSNNHVLGSSMMRNAALKQLDLSGGFMRYQDWDRWITMVEAGWKIGLIEEPLFYYRQDDNSLSHSATIEQELEIRKLLLKKHKAAYIKYYEEVILELDKRRLEIEASKNKLGVEYRDAISEIKKYIMQTEELSATIREYKEIINTLEKRITSGFPKRVRRKIKSKTYL